MFLKFKSSKAPHRAQPFSGEYRSLKDVPVSRGGYTNERLLEQELAHVSKRLKETQGATPRARVDSGVRNLFPLMAATLLRTHTSLDVLDFGGGMAQTFLDCRAAGVEVNRLRFHIVETQISVEMAQPLFIGNPSVLFYTTVPQSLKPHVALIKSSLQYVDDYADTLRQITALQPDNILLAEHFMGRMPTFATRQVNMSETELACWLFNTDEIISLVERGGYRLAWRGADRPLSHDLTNFNSEYGLRDTVQLLFHMNRESVR